MGVSKQEQSQGLEQPGLALDLGLGTWVGIYSAGPGSTGQVSMYIPTFYIYSAHIHKHTQQGVRRTLSGCYLQGRCRENSFIKIFFRFAARPFADQLQDGCSLRFGLPATERIRTVSARRSMKTGG